MRIMRLTCSHAIGSFLRAAAGCMALCLLQPALAEDALQLGVIPYLSTRSLVSFYEPVQKALERRLGRRIELATAPDYPTFHQRTLNREYDILITNPVFGRIAQKEAGYEPIARAATNLTPVIIVPQRSAIAKPGDLSGVTIAITEKTATITQIGQDYLRRHNVRDVKYVVTRSHPNSVAFLERGEADAAISSLTALKQTGAPAGSAQIRVLVEVGSAVPPILYMLASGKSGLSAAALREALLEFARSEAGQRYIDALGHKGIIPAQAQEMAALDPYAEELKPQLK